jgi:hypothetical protein
VDEWVGGERVGALPQACTQAKPKQLRMMARRNTRRRAIIEI